MSELVIKLLVILLLAAFLSVFLKDYNSTAAMLTAVAAASVVLGIVLKTVFPAISTLGSILSSSSDSKYYFASALKALGIAYISSFAADVCRDFGQSSLAAKAEFTGRCAIFIITVPMMTGIAETALGLAKL